MKHGGKVKYRFCNAERCGNVTQKGGYCKRHYNDFFGGDDGGGAVNNGEGGSNKKRRSSDASEGCGVGSSGNTAAAKRCSNDAIVSYC